MTKTKFTKFNADQSKLYRKQLALKLKLNLQLIDSNLTFYQTLENPMGTCQNRLLFK